MDIQHIWYYVAVVKYESFSKAAEKLFVTQPILTRCVKNLEEELGVPLILRSTKRFLLTDAGRILYLYGQKLLQQHEDLYRRIADVTDCRVGEISISCPGVLLDMYFPELGTSSGSKILVFISIFGNGVLDLWQKISAMDWQTLDW